MYADQSEMNAAVLAMAGHIADKSPVAVLGTKVNLNYARDNTTAAGLDYVVSLRPLQHPWPWP